ncbi:MAG: phosphate:acyl-[acyl carrier protein] acyltransferase [Gammaproteobacteria bacterium]|nr:phosphate:acyl-[acyl carrier protein] acyltransferase [Gammaproteobacteria bacterium]
MPAALAAAREYTEVRFTLIGRQADLEREMSTGRVPPNVSCLFAAEVVEMTDHPREALRRKKNSSMRRALDLVKSHEANACVSAGNTGALMAMAHFVLKMLPGVERPAIVSMIPSRGGHTYMLDLGANASCTPKQLCQFGVMGSILAADLEGAHERPRVGLLNIGEEEIKGNDVVQAAHNLLSASDLNYVGFVEGHDIFSDKVDVVVTDGFTGNVALKTMEGAAQLITETLREEFTRNITRKLRALAAKPALDALRTRLDPRRYNGATMVGLNGIVIKSHGGADLFGFQRAIEVAIQESRNGVPARIAERLGAPRGA